MKNNIFGAPKFYEGATLEDRRNFDKKWFWCLFSVVSEQDLRMEEIWLKIILVSSKCSVVSDQPLRIDKILRKIISGAPKVLLTHNTWGCNKFDKYYLWCPEFSERATLNDRRNFYENWLRFFSSVVHGQYLKNERNFEKFVLVHSKRYRWLIVEDGRNFYKKLALVSFKCCERATLDNVRNFDKILFFGTLQVYK